MQRKYTNLLAFGDSLTWGSCPHTGGRHPVENRWPDAMMEGLNDVHLVTEGLRGRTTAYSRPASSAEMSGVVSLPALLHSHAPLDLVIIMLGTNDIYEGYEHHQIRDGLNRLVEIIRHHPYRLPSEINPQILLISPPPVSIGNNPDVTVEKVQQAESLPSVISGLASELGCAFFDAAMVVRASVADGFHLEAEDSRALGLALQPAVKTLIS